MAARMKRCNWCGRKIRKNEPSTGNDQNFGEVVFEWHLDCADKHQIALGVLPQDWRQQYGFPYSVISYYHSDKAIARHEAERRRWSELGDGLTAFLKTQKDPT